MKINRQEVYDKCNGLCAYCGDGITIKQMQVDHVKPLYRNDDDTTLQGWGVERGTDDMDNLLPSCSRCNKWKSTYTLEKFNSCFICSMLSIIIEIFESWRPLL